MTAFHTQPRRPVACLFALLLSLQMGKVAAQEADTYYQEQYKLIKAPNAVMALTDSPFGDSVNLYNGRLEFVQTDVSLTGNSALPVAVGRRVVAGELPLDGRQFGIWEMDVPHIHGTFSSVVGWKAGDRTDARCTKFGRPPLVAIGGSNNRSYWDPAEYWQGSFLYVPGRGDQQMLQRAAVNQMAPGPASDYPVVTAGLWSIACLPQLKNGSGEGFLAISPDGTRYYFDWMAKFEARRMTKSDPSERPALTAYRTADSELVARPPLDAPAPRLGVYVLTRDDVWLLPSQVIDRFGNVVTYTYDPAKPRNLQRIASSDGRSITITYVPTEDGRFDVVDTVTDNVRTWRYSYRRNSVSGKTELERVVLPDASTWDFSNFYELLTPIRLRNNGGCESLPLLQSSSPVTGSLVHPSGAIGSFTLLPTMHGRSQVPKGCDITNNSSPFPRFFATMSLAARSITGPGLAALGWTYDYGPPNGSWSTCTNCIATKTVTMTDPSNHVTRYTFGNAYNVNEGRLQVTEIGWDGSGAAKTIRQHYRAFGAGPYPEFLGFADDGNIGDSDVTARPAPLEQRVTTEQGVDFNWEVQLFDQFARPVTVKRSSSLGSSRTERTEYFDHLPKWILGQVASVTEINTGKVISRNAYDPLTAALTSITRFGHLDQLMTYYGDGTLHTRKDAKNPVTEFSAYKFGIPQTIKYPDGSSERAVVNDIGRIKSITDAMGATTSFEYDAVGRLAKIAYPANDSVYWLPTFVTFERSSEPAFDLPAGHWRQTVQTGNAYDVNYYDALWRPVYTARWDQADKDNTIRITRRWFDHAGRVTYESYPKRKYEEISAGVHHEYDASGRPTVTGTISERGTLFSGYYYGYDQFRKVYTDANGNSTVYRYQVFDEPSDSAIANASMPEGVNLAIERDLFGKPLSVTRSGGGKSVTRRYVYDNFERLCKIIEPEVGATVIEYDAANNVLWRAPGLNLPSATCDRERVPWARQIYFEYDALNRLRKTTYHDGSPQIERDYWPNGLLRTMRSDGATWTYFYNKRGLNETEQLNYGGATYTLGRKYTEHAAVAQLTYPGNLTVQYEPNALGEPRRVGNFATAITYHPNGALASFTYGNGITHTMVPNTRGLPLQVIDNGVLNDVYTYDNNGNPASITDVQEGVSTRSMTYDGLDRLRTVSAPAMWGSASYDYDALDNLTKTIISAGATARSTIHTYNPTTNRLDNINGPTGYNLNYLYDDYGNVKQRGSQKFVFDLGNRMRAATGKGTYAYDGWGHRVSVVGSDGVNRIQVYGRDGRLMYAAPTSAQQSAGTRYLYLDRHVIAEVGSGANVQYEHTDGLGSPVALTNGFRAILSRTRYEPFGTTVAGTPGAIGFTGHMNAADLGLVYMVARFYDPTAARFLSIDPVVTDANTGGSFNRYAYANNNPYRYVDPDGRFAFLLPLVPYLVDATVVVVGHYVLPGRQGREDTARAVGNAILNGGSGDKGNTNQAGGTKVDGQRPTKIPNEGTPGSTYINPGSGQERKYGSDGKPVQDIDHDHDHGQGVPHIHDWGRDANGRPVRGPGRPVDPKPVPKPEPKPKPDESK